MPTEQQLFGALKQAEAAGEFQEAQRFADMIKAQRSSTNQQQPLAANEPQLEQQPVEQPERRRQPSGNSYLGLNLSEDAVGTDTERDEYAAGITRAAAGGAAAGFGDEIEARTVSMLGKQTYKEALEEVRELKATFSEKNPATAMIAEGVGAVSTSGLGAVKGIQATNKLVQGINTGTKVGKNLARGAKALQVGSISAAEGAVFGAGMSDADFGSPEFYDDVEK